MIADHYFKQLLDADSSDSKAIFDITSSEFTEYISLSKVFYMWTIFTLSVHEKLELDF